MLCRLTKAALLGMALSPVACTVPVEAEEPPPTALEPEIETDFAPLPALPPATAATWHWPPRHAFDDRFGSYASMGRTVGLLSDRRLVLSNDKLFYWTEAIEGSIWGSAEAGWTFAKSGPRICRGNCSGRDPFEFAWGDPSLPGEIGGERPKARWRQEVKSVAGAPLARDLFSAWVYARTLVHDAGPVLPLSHRSFAYGCDRSEVTWDNVYRLHGRPDASAASEMLETAMREECLDPSDSRWFDQALRARASGMNDLAKRMLDYYVPDDSLALEAEAELAELAYATGDMVHYLLRRMLVLSLWTTLDMEDTGGNVPELPPGIPADALAAGPVDLDRFILGLVIGADHTTAEPELGKNLEPPLVDFDAGEPASEPLAMLVLETDRSSALIPKLSDLARSPEYDLWNRMRAATLLFHLLELLEENPIRPIPRRFLVRFPAALRHCALEFATLPLERWAEVEACLGGPSERLAKLVTGRSQRFTQPR